MRWFGHVQRRVIINTPMRKSELIQIEGTKKSRRKRKITLWFNLKSSQTVREII